MLADRARRISGAVIHPCRNASNNSASDSIELRAGFGGPISATTRSRSVTRTVSPPAASRTYSLNLFLSVLRPTERIIQCSYQRLHCQTDDKSGEQSSRDMALRRINRGAWLAPLASFSSGKMSLPRTSAPGSTIRPRIADRTAPDRLRPTRICPRVLPMIVRIGAPNDVCGQAAFGFKPARLSLPATPAPFLATARTSF